MGVPHAFPVHIPPYPQISPQQSKVFKPYQAPSTLINHPPFLSGVGDIGDVLFYRRFTNGVGGVSFADSGSFARNNVAVWIRSYASSCPATNIAKQIDVSILRASGVEP